MQFTSVLLTAILALTVSAAPQGSAQDIPDAATIASLVPEFGVTAGQSPDGTGNCVTPLAKALIACDCPPPRDEYIGALTFAINNGSTFGLPVPFPTGTDNDSKKNRLQTMLAVMQNVKGDFGKGCPAIATRFKQELDALPKA